MREASPDAALLDEGMRICIDVIRLLEREPGLMHARDYLIAARFVRAALHEHDDFTLIELARRGDRVLADAAEALLFERGLDHLVADEAQRRCAAWLAEQAMHRLRRGESIETGRAKALKRSSRPRRA